MCGFYLDVVSLNSLLLLIWFLIRIRIKLIKVMKLVNLVILNVCCTQNQWNNNIRLFHLNINQTILLRDKNIPSHNQWWVFPLLGSRWDQVLGNRLRSTFMIQRLKWKKLSCYVIRHHCWGYVFTGIWYSHCWIFTAPCRITLRLYWFSVKWLSRPPSDWTTHDHSSDVVVFLLQCQTKLPWD